MAFSARYAGTCQTCRGAIAQGEQIQALKGRRRGYEHTDCTAATGELTFKRRHGRCEDAPCCGCCGTGQEWDSRPMTWYSSADLDELEAEQASEGALGGAATLTELEEESMPDFSHLEDNAAEAELAWIETRPWNNR